MDEFLDFENIGHDCSYFSIDEFLKITKDRCEKFSTLTYNIRSLKNKEMELRNFIYSLSHNKFSLSAISLTEVWYGGGLV